VHHVRGDTVADLEGGASMGMVGSRRLTWGAVGAGVIGGVVGVVVAVIVSTNFAINLAVPNGYEASIADDGGGGDDECR
jgi:hypothetical protein